MHFQGAAISALAVASTLASPMKKGKGKEKEKGEACLKECVRMTILPFVDAAGEEGFRQALGAHNTTQACMDTLSCRDTLEVLVEEITNVVAKDRLDPKANGETHQGGGYIVGQHCDSDCLVNTARAAAGQAGIVAMTIGRKHFYGNDNMWNRWSPRQMLELDQAIIQLRGTDHLFDTFAFSYSTIPEVQLLYHQKLSRAEAKKILATIPGWGAAPETVPAGDYNRWMYGNAFSHYRDSLLAMNVFNGDEKVVGFHEEQQKSMRHAYKTIYEQSPSNSIENFVHFIATTRFLEKSKAQNMQMLGEESRKRWLQDMLTYPELQPDRVEEDYKTWNWTKHAFGVRNLQELGMEAQPMEKFRPKLETPRLTQWATDSQATPLKSVEGGFTHQPWTVPFFFEYRTNTSHMQELNPDMSYEQAQNYLNWVKESANATAIRGYMIDFEEREKFKTAQTRDDIFDERGAIKDMEMFAPLMNAGSLTSGVLAITTDGRVLRRQLSRQVEKARDKTYYPVLDEEGKPLFTEEGEPIKLIYDEKTGLLEARYGRALKSLDNNVQPFA